MSRWFSYSTGQWQLCARWISRNTWCGRILCEIGCDAFQYQDQIHIRAIKGLVDLCDGLNSSVTHRARALYSQQPSSALHTPFKPIFKGSSGSPYHTNCYRELFQQCRQNRVNLMMQRCKHCKMLSRLSRKNLSHCDSKLAARKSPARNDPRPLMRMLILNCQLNKTCSLNSLPR